MGNTEKWKGVASLPPTIQVALKRLPELLTSTDVRLVYLFGSLSEGKMGKNVDLAILTENSPLYSLRDELIAFLGTERLDIVDLLIDSYEENLLGLRDKMSSPLPYLRKSKG